MKKQIQIFAVFIMIFCFSADTYSQWVKYTNPIIKYDVNDIVFFDKNIGLMAYQDTALLYRTTDGGNNWALIKYFRIYQFEKIDSVTVYGQGRPNLSDDRIYRTFDKGVTWDSVAITGNVYRGISFVNCDTGWVSGFDGGNYRIWITTNGGTTLQTLPVIIGKGKIFFLKYKIYGEYYGWCANDIYMYRTTNSGLNWIQAGTLPGVPSQVTFINEYTGWAACGDRIMKTTNGGINWITQYMPTGNGIILNLIQKFFIVGNDTLYGDDGERYFGNGGYKGIIWKTTNGGTNWGFQQPDTSYTFHRYHGMYFIDSLTGFTSLVKTTNGGGPVILTEVNNNATEIPKSFELKQNYPNPFNPQTAIEFSIFKSSNVTLKIYDITGKEIISVMNNLCLGAGIYKSYLDFSRSNLSSGVYFCRLVISDGRQKQIFSQTKKMIYNK
jgi:photosystem II stability/assembly factor-like uncharacterized protein